MSVTETENPIEDSDAPVAAESPPAPAEDVRTLEDTKFSMDVDKLIGEAEDKRLRYMRQSRTRGGISLTFGILAVMVGGGGFGWFFLMEGDLAKALACILLGGGVTFLLNLWAQMPLRAYRKDFKINFMPQMAKLLGRLQFHPARGISAKILPRTGIVPSYEEYHAEDCFMGRYKGVKIIMSEARLKRKKDKVFDGIFVMLEIPQANFSGHTIITNDERAIKSWRQSRWQKFQDVPVTHADYGAHFHVFSTKPEASAVKLAGDKLLKEMLEMAVLFENAPVSAAFFGGKYVFLSIGYEVDMFEPSQIELPVTTKEHALQCKREIEQILSIVDILEIYEKA